MMKWAIVFKGVCTHVKNRNQFQKKFILES